MSNGCYNFSPINFLSWCIIIIIIITSLQEGFLMETARRIACGKTADARGVWQKILQEENSFFGDVVTDAG